MSSRQPEHRWSAVDDDGENLNNGLSFFELMYRQQQQEQSSSAVGNEFHHGELPHNDSNMESKMSSSFDQQRKDGGNRFPGDSGDQQYPVGYNQFNRGWAGAAPSVGGSGRDSPSFAPFISAYPPQPLSHPEDNTQEEKDYYKGFYQGATRKTSTNSAIGSTIYWVIPIAINLAIFILPIWYIRRQYAGPKGASMFSRAASSKADVAAGEDAANSENPFTRMMNSMMPLKPKKYQVNINGTTFADVIGIPEAKDELQQYIDFLKFPEKFTRLGARLPKGCLLTGNPGTGKTLLARAVAGEAHTPFLAANGADFIELFGGSGPRRVRELFAEARTCAPCVCFIDELDAIGSRGGGRTMGGGSSEENRTINQLLSEMDGIQTEKAPVVVLAATNYPDAIDKALLRDGRFDRKINIDMPDTKARNEIFTFYLNKVITGDARCKPNIMKMKTKEEKEQEKKKPWEKKSNNKQGKTKSNKKNDNNDINDGKNSTETTDCENSDAVYSIPIPVIEGVDNTKYAAVLADRTPGVSPAQISTIINEAALAAAIKDEPVVTLDYLQDAIDDVLIGKKHRQRFHETALRRTAFHECGHAMMAWLQPLQKDVIKISIIPRGRAGGYTQQIQEEILEPHTDEQFFSQLCVLLGGRVGEKIMLGDISTGALDDLQRATKIAVNQILTYGMSKDKMNLAFQPDERRPGRAWMTWSEQLHKEAENEARKLVAKAYQKTLETLGKHKEKLEKLAMLLLKMKELKREDITGILGPKAKQETSSHTINGRDEETKLREVNAKSSNSPQKTNKELK